MHICIMRDALWEMDYERDTRTIVEFGYKSSTLQLTATHCNILQYTTTHCNTLQHTAIHRNTLYNTLQLLQHNATHCNTLQFNATHWNTLQHPQDWPHGGSTTKPWKKEMRIQIITFPPHFSPISNLLCEWVRLTTTKSGRSYLCNWIHYSSVSGFNHLHVYVTNRNTRSFYCESSVLQKITTRDYVI